MVTFRNNNRRGRFRSNDRNYKRNGDTNKFKSDFSTNTNFQRKAPGRNNHNAPKLIEKYNDLAREASSNGDKILSENYFQHADHFTRILNEQESQRRARISDSKSNESALDAEGTFEKVEDKTEAINNVSEIKPMIKKNTETS